MPKPDLAVVIGRFQVPRLTQGHRDFLWWASQQGQKLLILVGHSQAPLDKRNPLDLATRLRMFEHTWLFGEAQGLADCQTDEAWSASIDALIGDRSAVICGGRDSCLTHYRGKHETRQFESRNDLPSGTEVRSRITYPLDTEDFRAGMVYAQNKRFPAVYPVVDIAAFYGPYVLLGKRDNEDGWRLPGGHVDPTDQSYEAAALRELREETGLASPEKLTYGGSYPVPAWKLRGSGDAMMTTLFRADFLRGITPTPGYDLDVVQWCPYIVAHAIILPEHVHLLERAYHNVR